jgi:hypothetical protein
MRFLVPFLRAGNARHAILVVLDGHLEGVGAQVGAVQLVLGQALQGFRHVLVGDGFGFGDGFALGDFGQHAGHGDGRAAAEGLEFDILDTVIVDLQIYRHDVAAQRIADFTDTVGILHHTDIARIAKVIHHCFAVHHQRFLPVEVAVKNFPNVISTFL